jgi:MFS family permease
MREATGRWALGLGAVAAAIGAGAQFLGGLLVPRQGISSFGEILRYLLLALPTALVALSLALGLAYFAGLRVERTRTPAPPSDELPRWGNERIESSFAGAIVMGLFCVFSALVAVLINLRFPTTSIGTLLAQRAVQTVLLTIVGFGMGALGARARAAHPLLDEIAPETAAPANAAPAETPAADTPTTAPASEDAAG